MSLMSGEKLLVKQILDSEKRDYETMAQGWVRTCRHSKSFSFIEINDGSRLENLQVIADKNLENYDQIKELTTGSSIGVVGKVVDSPGKGQKVEMQCSKVVIYGLADSETYPLQKKGHTLEFMRSIAHLRPRSNTFGCVFRIRHSLSYAIHKFFHENGFYYIHTPVITSSDCEGAGAMFRVTSEDPADFPRDENANPDYSEDFFGKPAFLTVSGQLEGEMFATALSRIYTFGPTFRAENSNTPRHLAEFWMVEPEMAFYDLEDNADLAEQFLKSVISDCVENNPGDIEFLSRWYKKDLKENLDHVINTTFERITYEEAVSLLERSGENFEYPVGWGNDLQTEHERYLVEKRLKKPVIVTDYPREIKAFYMRRNDDGKTVGAMDILFPGIGEIVGGSQREERLDVLLQAIKESGLSGENYQWYIDSRRFGTTPHSGFGLGFERALQFITGMANIRDVIPFPRYPGHVEF